jgi:hypothetical protein
MDQAFPPFETKAPSSLAETLGGAEPGQNMRLQLSGVDAVGEPREWVVVMAVPEGADGAARLEATGMTLVDRDGKTIIDDVAFDSPAKKAELDWDMEITSVEAPVATPSKYIAYVPALLILALLVIVQRRRAAAMA